MFPLQSSIILFLGLTSYCVNANLLFEGIPNDNGYTYSLAQYSKTSVPGSTLDCPAVGACRSVKHLGKEHERIQSCAGTADSRNADAFNLNVWKEVATCCPVQCNGRFRYKALPRTSDFIQKFVNKNWVTYIREVKDFDRFPKNGYAISCKHIAGACKATTSPTDCSNHAISHGSDAFNYQRSSKKCCLKKCDNVYSSSVTSGNWEMYITKGIQQFEPVKFSGGRSTEGFALSCPHIACNTFPHKDFCANWANFFFQTRKSDAFNWHPQSKNCCIKKCNGEAVTSHTRGWEMYLKGINTEGPAPSLKSLSWADQMKMKAMVVGTSSWKALLLSSDGRSHDFLNCLNEDGKFSSRGTCVGKDWSVIVVDSAKEEDVRANNRYWIDFMLTIEDGANTLCLILKNGQPELAMNHECQIPRKNISQKLTNLWTWHTIPPRSGRHNYLTTVRESRCDIIKDIEPVERSPLFLYNEYGFKYAKYYDNGGHIVIGEKSWSTNYFTAKKEYDAMVKIFQDDPYCKLPKLLHAAPSGQGLISALYFDSRGKKNAINGYLHVKDGQKLEYSSTSLSRWEISPCVYGFKNSQCDTKQLETKMYKERKRFGHLMGEAATFGLYSLPVIGAVASVISDVFNCNLKTPGAVLSCLSVPVDMVFGIFDLQALGGAAIGASQHLVSEYGRAFVNNIEKAKRNLGNVNGGLRVTTFEMVSHQSDAEVRAVVTEMREAGMEKAAERLEAEHKFKDDFPNGEGGSIDGEMGHEISCRSDRRRAETCPNIINPNVVLGEELQGSWMNSFPQNIRDKVFVSREEYCFKLNEPVPKGLLPEKKLFSYKTLPVPTQTQVEEIGGAFYNMKTEDAKRNWDLWMTKIDLQNYLNYFEEKSFSLPNKIDSSNTFAQYKNKENYFPQANYYQETLVGGFNRGKHKYNRGTQRMLVSSSGDVYFLPDHYEGVQYKLYVTSKDKLAWKKVFDPKATPPVNAPKNPAPSRPVPKPSVWGQPK